MATFYETTDKKIGTWLGGTPWNLEKRIENQITRTKLLIVYNYVLRVRINCRPNDNNYIILYPISRCLLV